MERRRRETRYSREVNEAYSRGDSSSLSAMETGKGNVGFIRANDTIYLNGTGSLDLDKNEKVSIKNNTYFIRVYKEVNVSTLSYVIKELRHFSTYKITVQACRESVPADFQEKIENCSTAVIVNQRTKKIGKWLPFTRNSIDSFYC